MSFDTDEEVVESIKRWWEENGTSVIVGIVLVLAVFFGSRFWESSRNAYAEAASEVYLRLVDNIRADTDLEVSDEELDAARVLHNQLREEFDNSVYSRFSALMMARLHVQRNELDSAVAELRWVLDNPGLGFLRSINEELELTARSRLARVVLAQGDAQAALDLLGEVEPGAFAGNFAEIEGDAYVTLGRMEEAREAYQSALDMGVNPEIVELKLGDIGS